MFYKVFLIRAQPTNTQSLAKHYRSFGVVWMSRQVIEILMTISRFYIQICNNLTVFNSNFKAKKCNAFFAWLICKFDVSMEFMKTTQKALKFLLTMCPNRKISSVYLNHTKGCNSWVSRKAVSILSIDKHAYGEANLLPIAVPEICCLIWPLLNLTRNSYYLEQNLSSLSFQS